MFFIKNNNDIFNDFINDNSLIEFHKHIKERKHPSHPKKENWGVISLITNRKINYIKIGDFDKFIMIIYQIRNNLFHWWKDIENDNSKKLIEKTNIVFENFLKNVYNIED